MNNVVTPAPKQPYTKPTLTKHKPLRDITAADISVVGGIRVLK